MSAQSQSFEEIKGTLKTAVTALKHAEIPFLLGGGLACWVRGAPESDHDLDLMVRAKDADRALETLAAAGMRPERPPEGWLYKAWDGDVLVDLIFHPAGGPIEDEHFERAEDLEVLAMPLKVMSLEDVLAAKLLALKEHTLDYASVLEISRSLREQVDWDDVRRRTGGSPFARAFFTLVEELEIVPPRAQLAAATSTEGTSRQSSSRR